MGLLKTDSEDSAAEGDQEVEAAMTLVRKEIALASRDWLRLRHGPSGHPLHVRPDFRAGLVDLALPADPFGRRR
jgi:hypothetical protein